MKEKMKPFSVSLMSNDDDEAIVVNKVLYDKDKAIMLAKVAFTKLYRPKEALKDEDFEVYINRVIWEYPDYNKEHTIVKEWIIPEFRRNFMGELAKIEIPVWVVHLKNPEQFW